MSEAQNRSRLPHWKADSIGTDRGTEKRLYGLELRLRLWWADPADKDTQRD